MGPSREPGSLLEHFASWMCLGLAVGVGSPPEQGERSRALHRARSSPSHMLPYPGWLKRLHRSWMVLPAPSEVGPGTSTACTSQAGFLDMHPASEAAGCRDVGGSVPVPIFLMLLCLAPQIVCFSCLLPCCLIGVYVCRSPTV